MPSIFIAFVFLGTFTMRFTPATAALVLASTALAAPQIHRHEELRPRGIARGDLSVTHQLMLSEL